MKMLHWGLASLLALSSSAFALTGENLDFHSYMRTGFGSNLEGGDLARIDNPGTPASGLAGNEFRLGNEDGTFVDMKFVGHNKKSQNANEPYWNTHFLMTYESGANNNSEDSTFRLRETFVEAGNLAGTHLNFWIGNRFYRSTDLHMMDWYYFGNVDGVGAGVENIPLANGKLSLALFNQVNDATDKSSDIGTHKMQLIDIRFFDFKLSEKHSLNFWGQVAQAPKGDNSVSHMGELIGVKFHSNLAQGFNDFSVTYGSRLLSSLGVWGDETLTAAEKDIEDESRTVRVVEHITTKLAPNFELHGAAYFQNAKNPWLQTKDVSTMGAGIRPVYFLNDNMSFATEIGHSIVDDNKKYHMTRITVAPQLHPNLSIWSRPVLRFFVTHTMWNEDNKGRIASGTMFEDKTSATQYGFQAEAWF